MSQKAKLLTKLINISIKYKTKYLNLKKIGGSSDITHEQHEILNKHNITLDEYIKLDYDQQDKYKYTVVLHPINNYKSPIINFIKDFIKPVNNHKCFKSNCIMFKKQYR